MLRLPRFKSQKLSDYAGTGPRFDIRQHLVGAMISEGMIYGPTGRVVSRFVAEMQGEWRGASGHLRESFRYATGAQQNREWRLTEGNDGQIIALADDIIGQGVGGAESCAFCMRYRIKLPDDAGGHVLSVTDWMYLLENGTILNRSQMRKFGVKVAELIATVRPSNDAKQAA